VPTPDCYDYALIRVVPRVDREEFVNAGVILSCEARGFLDARVQVDAARLAALDPQLDIEMVARHLHSIPVVCRGGPDAGPIGGLTRRQRFHWLVAPRSAIIQTSAVHSGVSANPQDELERLMQRMVLLRT
jgi:hypothetical protein